MKGFLRFVNVVFCLIGAACATIFALPQHRFVSLEANYTLKEDELEKFMGDTLDIDGDGVNDVDFKSIIDDKGVEIVIPITITNETIYKAYKVEEGKEKEYIADILLPSTIKNVVDSLMPIVKDVTDVLVKNLANIYLDQMIDKMFNDGETPLGDIPVDQQFIDDSVNTIINELTKDNANVKDLSDSVINILNDALQDAKDAGNVPSEYNLPVTSAEVEKALTDMVDSVGLNEIIDEEGNIASTDEIIGEVFNLLLDGVGDSIEENQNSDGGKSSKSLRSKDVDTTKLSNTLSAKLLEMINDYVPYEKIVKGVRYCALFNFSHIGLWGLLFILSLIALFKPKRPWFNIVLFIFIMLLSLVQIFVGPVLSGIVLFTKKIFPFVFELIPGIGAFSSILSAFSAKFYSICFIPGFAAIFVFILYVPYNITKKKLKKRYKKEAETPTKQQ